MERKQDKWINEVMHSLDGSSRAKPNDSLFTRIERELEEPHLQIVSRRQLLMAVAAAVALLLVNVSAWYNLQSTSVSTTPIAVERHSDQMLISNYNFYAE